MTWMLSVFRDIMYTPATSVSQAVREVLASNTMYQEMLESGIANLTAMAGKLKPEVENKAQSHVNTNTIVAALKRLVDDTFASRGSIESKGRVPNSVRISLNDSIIDVDFEAQECSDLFALFDKVINTEDATFLFQTSKKCRMFTESTHLYAVAKRVISEQIRPHIVTKLSRITLTFQLDQKNILNNLLFEISRFLFNARIDIHYAYFSPSEIVLILNNDDAVKLYDMLHA
jgi:hypothetical protein